jgi:hypothetical protein
VESRAPAIDIETRRGPSEITGLAHEDARLLPGGKSTGVLEQRTNGTRLLAVVSRQTGPIERGIVVVTDWFSAFRPGR